MSAENWKKGYKETKNVIHNDIGVSKEEILEVFKVIAMKEIKNFINASFTKEQIRSLFKEVIREEMIETTRRNTYPKVHGRIYEYGHHGGENSFNDFMTGIMKEEIVKSLSGSFNVKLDIQTTETEKDDSE